MFGQHHDESSQHGQVAEPGNISDDGTLGISPPGSSMSAAPDATSDDASNSTTPLPQTFRQQSSAPAVTLPSASPEPSSSPDPLAAASSMPSLSSPSPVRGGMPSDLMNIKQEALQQLKPLVGHLDQTPEEKFRTTMMMIQASDDQSLIGDAYEAAKAIADEKVQAQALLDVVNEINYFTSQNPQS